MKNALLMVTDKGESKDARVKQRRDQKKKHAEMMEAEAEMAFLYYALLTQLVSSPVGDDTAKR